MVAREQLDPDASLWDWIAADLHIWREKHGLSLADVGRILGIRREHVSNIEAGRRRLQEDQAAKLDKTWELHGHFSRLLRYARAGHDPDWFKEHLELEAQASELRIFESMLIPGLLQTAEYARCVFESAGADPDQGVKSRLARQDVLQRDPMPWLWVVMDEQVLKRVIGGRQVMRDQLAKILEISAMPKVTVQVVPVSTGWYPGVNGAFKLMRVKGVEYAYTSAAEGGRLAGDASDIRAFGVRYDLIRSRAWPADATQRVVKRAMETLS